ncbi:hypothetical protein, partial [Caldalkalibacillus mannanilyticus]|uniref:hypothetical protein n=1 Tax=Caldalkalibacillus mannanilyticus TaxID=1418 RepID=UPI0005538827
IYLVISSPFIVFLFLQFMFDSNPYSPINLTGVYIAVYVRYSLLEIPLFLLISWSVISATAFGLFIFKNKNEVT